MSNTLVPFDPNGVPISTESRDTGYIEVSTRYLNHNDGYRDFAIERSRSQLGGIIAKLIFRGRGFRFEPYTFEANERDTRDSVMQLRMVGQREITLGVLVTVPTFADAHVGECVGLDEYQALPGNADFYWRGRDHLARFRRCESTDFRPGAWVRVD